MFPDRIFFPSRILFSPQYNTLTIFIDYIERKNIFILLFECAQKERQVVQYNVRGVIQLYFSLELFDRLQGSLFHYQRPSARNKHESFLNLPFQFS